MRVRLIAVACAAAAILTVTALPSSSAAPAGPQSSPGATRYVMPNVVGMTLQDAQDLLQSKGSYLMDQEDARGLGRWQLLDSNWKVCRQRPAAGVRVSTSATVTLWSVKLNERCPR